MIIDLDYPVNSRQRYGNGKPPHKILYEIINENRGLYKQYLNSFLKFRDNLVIIPKALNDSQSNEPAWINGFIPGLDSTALYSILSLNNPKNYIEIGSGNSTKFARRAINDHKLRTRITSIDPCPRAEINSICDKIIRQPVEDIDISLFNELGAGDILFVDNSHRIFMNSDATVVFLDILPNLKSGVFVEFHDIFLPYDYPFDWIQRYYSEQYLLAAYLLAQGDKFGVNPPNNFIHKYMQVFRKIFSLCNKFNIILPNNFISNDPELNKILSPLWEDSRMEGVEVHGGSFWIKIR